MKRLDQIRERLEASTPGPWVHDEEGFMGCGQVYTMGEGVEMGNIAAPSGDLYARSGYSPKDDMILIANAPTDITALLSAVEGVLALHREAFRDVEPWARGYKFSGHHCAHDGDHWPCPTVAAITTAVEGK